MVDGVRRRLRVHRRWQRDGEPSLARQFARVGVLGWLIVVPTLGGILIGRTLDARFGSGIFFSGAWLLAGLCLGCWSGWRWMRQA
ncbi:AtpZ/AtpI family protein [Hydrocarboniphaga sp.]|uniref:AtpZ/AtpI family protein n=1 Tax=Hydrocarboniphaga sp. TaxID=2033016 RepID=UPI0026273327|nr:AtpZ/AtpI family protein [Hydrocarboniphaga sp.]